MKAFDIVFKAIIIPALIFLLLAACAAPVKTAQQVRTDGISQQYQDAYKRHFADADKWMVGLSEYVEVMRKCNELAKTNPAGRRACLDGLPKPENFLPADRKNDETLLEYTERKNDEWEEQDCSYRGFREARYLGENQRIEDQCKRDLEVKRLRKAVEKLNSQKRQ